MKKKWILLFVSMILVILMGTILFFTLKPTQNNLISITGSELLEKIKNKETFILIRTQDGCHHCEEYKPILNRILKEENLEAYELNLTELRKEEENIQNEVKKLFNVDGTPVTIFIQNGEEQTTINRIIGTTTYSNLKNKLKDRGFIN